jgi:hypothetical protein
MIEHRTAPLILFALLLFGCAEKYSLDLKRALEFKNISYEEQLVVEVVGVTNGPFRSVGTVGMLSAGQPGILGYTPERGAGVAWKTPAGSTNAYVGYAFADASGHYMLVVKSVLR